MGEGVTFCLYILSFFYFTSDCSMHVVPTLLYILWFLATCFVERVGAEVVECACVIGVPDVKVIITY